MKNTINRFSGTKMSGLQKQLFNQIDNGGINEIHLHLLLNRKDPWDYNLYCFCEVKFFFREIFDLGIQFDQVELPQNKELNPGFSHFIVIPSEVKLSLEKILTDWEKYSGKAIISTTPFNFEPPIKEENLFKVRKWVPGVMTGNGIVLSHNTSFSVLHGMVDHLTLGCGLTLREVLLRMMFLYWKYKTINCFVGLTSSKQDPLVQEKAFIIPCYATRYINQPAKELKRISYPLVVVKYNKEISICRSGGYNQSIGSYPIIDNL